MPVLKADVTTACERDCFFCPFRAGRSSLKSSCSIRTKWRAVFAQYRAGAVEGVFLLVGDHSRRHDQPGTILDTGAFLRQMYIIAGYMHLKLMRARSAISSRGDAAATRVSINLEAPNAQRLEQYCAG
jgi:predicted DNA-binding helix-hairpin-helix protein